MADWSNVKAAGDINDEHQADIDRWDHQALAEELKKLHRRCAYKELVPREHVNQFATRALGKEVKFIDDLTDDEINRLRQMLYDL